MGSCLSKASGDGDGGGGDARLAAGKAAGPDGAVVDAGAGAGEKQQQQQQAAAGGGGGGGGGSTANNNVSSSSSSAGKNNGGGSGQNDNEGDGEEGEEGEGEEEDDDYAGADAPICELDRRQHLLDLNIMNTEPEARFDDVTRLCTMVFKVPIALVSLVGETYQWFKSAQGVPGVDRTPRNTSFCAWTLLPVNPAALVVEDARADARFRRNPLVVGAPFIRFYAGCPLVCSNGLRLGSLCIIDKEPRAFDAESCNMLANMAEMVVREIEREKAAQQRALAHQRRSKEQLLRAMDCFDEAIMLVDVSKPRAWSVVFANEAWEELVGAARTPGAALPFWEVFSLPSATTGSGGAHVHRSYAAAIEQQQNFELLLQSTGAGAGARACRWLQAQFRCAATTGLDAHMLPIGIPSFLPSGSGAGGQLFYFATLSAVAPPAISEAGSASLGSAAASSGIIAPLEGASSGGGGGSAGALLPAGAALAGNAAAAAAAAAAAGAGAGPRGGQQQQQQQQQPRRRTNPARMASFSLIAPADEPFADVKLGVLLGRGSFGRVFRATWNGRTVACKVIEHSRAAGGGPRQAPGAAALVDGETLLEGLLSQQVQHPNIVATYKYATRELRGGGGGGGGRQQQQQQQSQVRDLDDDDDDDGGDGDDDGGGDGEGQQQRQQQRRRQQQLLETWIVLEFCNRGDLSTAAQKGWFTTARGDQRLKHQQQQPQQPQQQQQQQQGGSSSSSAAAAAPCCMRALLATAREVAGALAYLHSRGIWHGDLTGGNVLLTVSGPDDPRGFVAKVSDFGLSRFASAEAPVIQTQSYGTVTHMPAELLIDGRMSAAVDVYSFGVLMWEMFTGRRPYQGLSHTQVLHAVTQGGSGAAHLQLPAAAPPAFRDLVAACLSRRPEERPDFGAVLARLEAMEAALAAAG